MYYEPRKSTLPVLFLIGFYGKQNSVELSCCRGNDMFLGIIHCLITQQLFYTNLISNLDPDQNQHNGYVYVS